jgi:hypothetical protein
VSILVLQPGRESTSLKSNFLLRIEPKASHLVCIQNHLVGWSRHEFKLVEGDNFDIRSEHGACVVHERLVAFSKVLARWSAELVHVCRFAVQLVELRSCPLIESGLGKRVNHLKLRTQSAWWGCYKFIEIERRHADVIMEFNRSTRRWSKHVPLRNNLYPCMF